MRPLDGIRVVELSTYVAVPTAARMLADWGAEVIKIETLGGDGMREYGKNQGLPADEGANPLFSVQNSGKLMLSLDLKDPDGKEVLMRLLEDADVFCTNVRLASIERMGLDYETLHARFPKLVYFHFSGFGYEGPDSGRPGYDAIAFWAQSGAMVDWPDPGSTPLRPAPAFGDMVCAFSILSGILGGLLHQKKTGEGLRITSSLLANGLWCNYSHLIAAQEGWETISFPREIDSEHNPMTCPFKCADGRWLMLYLSFPGQFAACMKTLGLDKYIDDPRFSDWEHLNLHYKDLYRIFREHLRTKPSDYWAGKLLKEDLAHQILCTTKEAGKSEQAWANGYLTRVKFPDGKEFVEPNSPVQFFGCDRAETTAAGNLGSDGRKILARLSYSEEDIQKLLRRGAVTIS